MIGFAGTHGDTFQLLERAEEVFDEMAPFVEFAVERAWLGLPRVTASKLATPAIVMAANLLDQPRDGTVRSILGGRPVGSGYNETDTRKSTVIPAGSFNLPK